MKIHFLTALACLSLPAFPKLRAFNMSVCWQALVYVSTAYCNCVVKDTIREEVYPSARDPDQVIRDVLSMSPEAAKEATRG